MKTLNVTVAHTGNNYCAMIDGLDNIMVSGNSIDEIKTNLGSAIEETIAACNESDIPIPELLSGSYELNYHMDVESFLNFYKNVFSKSGLERLTGINQKQLWHYASGGRKPRREQVNKIESALHHLGKELLSISF
jgi:predicted RNase H-like HicB family nuclease